MRSIIFFNFLDIPNPFYRYLVRYMLPFIDLHQIDFVLLEPNESFEYTFPILDVFNE